jgi:anti-sigma-K factor RskA
MTGHDRTQGGGEMNITDGGPADQAEDRAIARALGADNTEVPAVDTEALDEYRMLLAHLPFEEVAPPPGLEDRVLAAALRTRPAGISTLDPARRRRNKWRWATLGAAAAAAAAVVAFVAITNDEPQPSVRGEIGPIAQREPPAGSRTATLQGVGPVGEVVLAPDGNGTIRDLTLPDPAAGRVFWVWLRTDGEPVRLGALTDADAAMVGFRVIGDVDAVRGVFVTLEPAGTTPAQPGEELASARF